MKWGLSKTPLWMSEAFTEVNMLHLPGLQNILEKKNDIQIWPNFGQIPKIFRRR